MAKEKTPKEKEPKSPHSARTLGDVKGRELDAWVAAELDGYGSVSKRQDGEYEGTKGGKRIVPSYRSPAAVKSLATNLIGGRRLVLSEPSGVVNIDSATPEQCELANRALILESMSRSGVI